MLKDKKILFAFIFLVLAIILVASSFYFKPKNKLSSTANTVVTSEKRSDVDYDLVLLPAKDSPKDKISQELYARYSDGQMEKIFDNNQLKKHILYSDYGYILNPGISYGNFAYIKSNDLQLISTFDKNKKIFLDNGIKEYTHDNNLEPLIFSYDYKRAVVKNHNYFAVVDFEKGLITNLFSVPQDYEITPEEYISENYGQNNNWISPTRFHIVISPKNNYKEQKIIIIDTQEQVKNDQILYLDYKSKSLFSINKDGVHILIKYIGDNKGVSFVGDEVKQDKVGNFHYFSGGSHFFGYNSLEDKFYFIPTSTIPFDDEVSLAGSVISADQSVALFLKYRDDKERLVVLSSDLQKIIYQKYLEPDYTFILSENYSFSYTIGELTKWLDKNVVRVALYDKDIPHAPAPRDCAGCDDVDIKGFFESEMDKEKAFENAVNNRKPVKFVDIKIK